MYQQLQQMNVATKTILESVEIGFYYFSQGSYTVVSFKTTDMHKIFLNALLYSAGTKINLST